MSDSQHMQDSGNTDEQQNPAPPKSPLSSPATEVPAKNTDLIKEKFLEVAKEKSRLEAVISQQKGAIKKLEEEKAKLTFSLERLTESYNKMQEMLLQGKSTGAQKDPSSSAAAAPPSSPFQRTPDRKADLIKEKFLEVAKEKGHLESVIMQQNEAIKRLEKEKADLFLSLRKFSESHKKMKEKLLDFDVLRNAEISELKKVIDQLMAENRRLVSIQPDQENVSLPDNRMADTLLTEKQDLEVRLSKAHEELRLLEEERRSGHERDRDLADISETNRELNDIVASLQKTVNALQQDVAAYESDLEETRGRLSLSEEKVQTLEHEETLLKSRLHETEGERDETRTELSYARAEIDRLVADKSKTEEDLRQKIREYSTEVSALRVDIDELTSAAENKIHYIDEVNEKINHLSKELSRKDTVLDENIPALLEKIDALSGTIDRKREENSLFAKELVDINARLSSLSDELVRKDDLLLGITEDYTNQKEEIAALHDAYAQTQKSLQTDMEGLKQENEELRNRLSLSEDMLAKAGDEKNNLEQKVLETNARVAELESDKITIAAYNTEKEKAYAALQHELAEFREQRAQADAEQVEELNALREMVFVLNQQLLEKNELITALSADLSDKSEKDSTISGLLTEMAHYKSERAASETEHMKIVASLQEQISILNQQLLEKDGLLTALNGDLIHKDELLLEITEDHKRQKEEIASLYDTYAQTLKGLPDIESLKQEIEELRTRASLSADMLEKARTENEGLKHDRHILEAKIADAAAEIAHKEKEHSALQHELNLFRERAAQAGNEQAGQLSALQEKVVILNQQLLEKNELLTALNTEQTHARAAFASLTESFRNEKADLESQVANATEKILDLAAGQDRLASLISEKDQALAQADAETKGLRALVQRMQEAVEGLEKKLEEKEQGLLAATTENEEHLKISHDYQEAFNHLKEEIVTLNQLVAEKESVIKMQTLAKEGLLKDLSDTQVRLEQALAVRSLEALSANKQDAADLLAAEKDDLLKTIADRERQMEALSHAKDAEIASLKEDLSTYGRAFADLGVRLEQSIKENEALRARLGEETARGIPAPSGEKEGIALPASIISRGKEVPAPRRHTLAYALLALILIAGIGFSFYAYNAGLFFSPTVKPVKSVQTADQKTDFPYIDMLSLLTRSSAAGELKFQATLMTEPLVVKSDDPEEASLFDFHNHRYFRITISSLKGILNKDLTANPYAYITLSTAAGDVSPISEKRVKQIKTFYKGDEPVSVTFYCAFPQGAPDTESLFLTLKKEAGQTTLAWDLGALRSHNLIR